MPKFEAIRTRIDYTVIEAPTLAEAEAIARVKENSLPWSNELALMDVNQVEA